MGLESVTQYFALFFIMFWLLGPLQFYMNFRIDINLYEERSWDSDMHCLLSQEGQENTAFITTLRNKLGRGAQHPWRAQRSLFFVSQKLQQDMLPLTWGFLSVKWITGFRMAGARWYHLIAKDKVVVVSIMDSWVPSFKWNRWVVF